MCAGSNLEVLLVFGAIPNFLHLSSRADESPLRQTADSKAGFIFINLEDMGVKPCDCIARRIKTHFSVRST